MNMHISTAYVNNILYYNETNYRKNMKKKYLLLKINHLDKNYVYNKYR